MTSSSLISSQSHGLLFLNYQITVILLKLDFWKLSRFRSIVMKILFAVYRSFHMKMNYIRTRISFPFIRCASSSTTLYTKFE